MRTLADCKHANETKHNHECIKRTFPEVSIETVCYGYSHSLKLSHSVSWDLSLNLFHATDT